MASTGNSSGDSIFKKLGLQPVTRCTLAKFYIPALGVTGYTGVALNVMNPDMLSRVTPGVESTNIFLGASLCGVGSYIYTREHMKLATPLVRLLYSCGGAVLFNFGSVLIWAVIRSIIMPNQVLSTIAGVGSGYLLVKGGHSYLQLVDSQIAKK